jgi:hypothetical protein
MLDELRHRRIPEHPNVSQMWIREVTMNGHHFRAIVELYYESGNILEVTRRIPGMDVLLLVKYTSRLWCGEIANKYQK